MDSNHIYKAGGLLIQNRKVLLNKQGGNDVYIVPGGQLENNETYPQALIRELDEEFQIIVSEGDLEELGEFDSPAVHHPDKIVKINLFLVKEWTGDIQISNEIEDIMWVNSTKAKELKISPFATNFALPLLLKRGLID